MHTSPLSITIMLTTVILPASSMDEQHLAFTAEVIVITEPHQSHYEKNNQ